MRNNFETPFKRKRLFCPPIQKKHQKRTRASKVPLPILTKRKLKKLKSFEKKKFLGKGDFGEVYCVNCKATDQKYALKQIKPNTFYKLREILIRLELIQKKLQKKTTFSSFNIIGVHQCWEENGFVNILMDFCEDGSLDELLLSGIPISEEQIWTIVYDIARGLEFMHSCGLVHLDLKPSNIFLTKSTFLNRPKKRGGGRKQTTQRKEKEKEGNDQNDPLLYPISRIGDLDLLCKMGQPIEQEGDSKYIACEILTGLLNETKRASFCNDIFSFGMTLYELSSGCQLKNNSSEWEMFRNMTHENNSFLNEEEKVKKEEEEEKEEEKEEEEEEKKRGEGYDFKKTHKNKNINPLRYRYKRSQDLKQLIRRMLCRDPKKRITTKEILEYPKVMEVNKIRSKLFNKKNIFIEKLKLAPRIGRKGLKNEAFSPIIKRKKSLNNKPINRILFLSPQINSKTKLKPRSLSFESSHNKTHKNIDLEIDFDFEFDFNKEFCISFFEDNKK
ncbi:membrane-associated tyrosine- and threonine-specific cdc2-inhibitory kinase [Anaeramoeba flamelloides]|uniref:Membrane-associated tyrosine- and threonine-specific cdc2-inhibitory kinase n=1 Tax=Anaeramoeba flamelloides TaxID=1746091 RepID=A0AAV8A8B2_9EUKA|nr:membrane-associated tyrosine- and threonine-specific cdc2-inhibitory kinase [Anaeramoeba flamelloides]